MPIQISKTMNTGAVGSYHVIYNISLYTNETKVNVYSYFDANSYNSGKECMQNHRYDWDLNEFKYDPTTSAHTQVYNKLLTLPEWSGGKIA